MSDNKREWLSIKEVGQILELKRDAVQRLCEKGVLDAQRVPHRGVMWWAIDPKSVEALLQQRKEEQAKRDAGFEWCAGHKAWEPRENFGYYGESKRKDCYCKPYRSTANIRSHKKKAKERRWYDGWGSDPVLAFLEDLISEGPAVSPQNSLKYACMDKAFAHRPIPFGQTKREAFCSKCKADFCVHYPEMTPEEVRRKIRPKVTYAKAR